jgi:transposase
LPSAAPLLAEDETDLLLFPSLRAGWAPRGKAAPVLISGYNARRTVFGALHLRSGNFLYLEQRRKRAEDFQEFLDFLRWHYRSWPIALLLDENSSHTYEESQSLADDLDIRLLWLPKRSPHLNPVDHLWWHAKGAISSNWQQSSIDQQVFEFIHYIQTHSRTELLRKAGMFSPDFWLYKV